MSWLVVYEKARRPNGDLLFPEKLSDDFLINARKVMGSYVYANQYENEIIPSDQLTFKPEWIKYYAVRPERVNTFAFIDPAISLEKTADYTGVVVIHVDEEDAWYVEYARHYRLSPTEIVDLVFKITDQYKPQCIGIEDVAYQKALLYMLDHKSKEIGKVVPVRAIKPGNDQSKEMRILGLVPRFEWGRIFLRPEQKELEDELRLFPRAAHDDIIDALSQVAQIAFKPERRRPKDERPNPADATNYESWYRRQLSARASREQDDYQ